MVLNVVTPERRLAHSPAGDMALVGGLFVVALTYLDVPFWNALLFGPTITLQAAVGVVVLTRLLKGVPGSLLLLLGPGLILGGAFSFAIFQLVGRGTLGLVVVVAVGIGAVAVLISSTTWQPLSASRMWTLGQILGLAALALTWEFPELLPVAAAFFVLGFFTGESPKAPRWLAWTVGVLASVAIAVVPILRQDYWWLITDDYQILEVQMRHWTISGVLADWGSHEWGRYHWLSGGWAGLLNLSGGNPETFTTLTRVMPLIYSASFAASLRLVPKAIVDTKIKSVAVNSATWTVVALNRLDWSGTSTGASVPVVVALVAILALNRNSVQKLPRRLAIAAIFLPIIALTKFPAIFVALLLLIGNEILVILQSSELQIRIQALLGGVLGVLGVALSIVVSIHWVGGFKLTTHNAELGQIADVGPILAMSLVTSLRLWILVIVATVLLIASQNYELSSTGSISRYLVSSALFFVTAVAFDVFIDAFNSNGHEYFSAPSYAVSSIAVLVAVSILPIRPTTIVGNICVALVVVFAFVWQHQDIAADIQGSLASRFHIAQATFVNLASYTLSSSTAAVSLLFLLVLVIGWLFKKPISRLLTPLLLSLAVVTIGALVPEHLHQIRHPRTEVYIESNIGSKEIREIANFLRMNAPNADLIGTNSLRGLDCALVSDYSLAVWSNRTFLILGPRFYGQGPRQVQATVVSESFARYPEANTYNQLWNNGVRWFVLDLRLTDALNWDPWADTLFRSKNYLILKLRSPSL